MNYKLLFTAAACAAAFLAVPVHADYTNWQDPNYDFKSVKNIYIARVDTSDISSMSSAKAKSLESAFQSRMNKAKFPKDLLLTLEAPAATKTLPASHVLKASVESGTEEDDFLAEARAANAQVYILPRLTRWQVKSYVEPAHMEWKSVQVRDAYKDKDGNWHYFYRTETYPDYVPAQEIPYAMVTMTFEWYDVQSGNLIASSEDDRTRNAENNPKGMYERIVDRFAKEMKKTVVGD